MINRRSAWVRVCVAALLVLAAGTVLAAETNEVVRLDGKTTVDAHTQGKITIGGVLILDDIHILPDGTVQHPWATRTRHVVTETDISALLDAKPEVLVIGTGHEGLMKPSAELKKTLKEKGIEVLILKTGAAIEKLKTLRGEGKKAGACVHIGC
jgi:hypothetical protein